MKKILLTMLFASAFCMAGKAQDFRMGVTGGYNLSAPSAYDSQSGFHVGFKGELGFPQATKGLYVTSVYYSRRMDGRVRGTTTTETIPPLLETSRTNRHQALLQTISVLLTI